MQQQINGVTDDTHRLDDLEHVSKRTRKRPVVLYFGRSFFGDNTKYVFLSDLVRDRGYKILWCTVHEDLARRLKDENIPCLLLGENPAETFEILMTAAVAVHTVNPRGSLGGSRELQAALAGATSIQLWHGVSVKHLLLELGLHFGYEDPAWLYTLRSASTADYVLSTSVKFDDYWSRTFGCSSLLRSNQPRNVMLQRPATGPEWIGSEIAEAAEAALSDDRKNVLVAPTWQRFSMPYTMTGDFIKDCMNYADTSGVNLFFKGHPMFADSLTRNSKAGRLHVLPAGMDIYPHLSRFDALVTDYSSIMFDFLYADKPIMALDMSRQPHMPYEPDWALVPGVECLSWFDRNSFHGSLESILADDRLSESRASFRSLIFDTEPDDAAATVLELVSRSVERQVAPSMRVVGG